QIAGDLVVAGFGGANLHWRAPSNSVVRVNHLQAADITAQAGIVVPGDVHPPVVGAGRVVVHPHRLAVVGAAAVGAPGRDPGDAVGRAPHAAALAAAAGRQVAGEPHAQVCVVHHDRVAKVGAMAGAKGLAG